MTRDALARDGYSNMTRMLEPRAGVRRFDSPHGHRQQLEWAFTHEWQQSAGASALLLHKSRQLLLVRVVREPLANIDAFHRYQTRTQPNITFVWDDVATRQLQNYIAFHRFWDGVCQKPTLCCIRTTYERLNDETALGLRELFGAWLPRQRHVDNKAIDAAVNAHSPLHKSQPGATPEWGSQLDFPSGNSFRKVEPQLLDAARAAGRLWLGASI